MGNLNLDCMDTTDLWSFSRQWRNAPRAMVQSLIGKHPGYTQTIRDLCNYAENKATAQMCRARGDIGTAQIYETICDGIYKRLPQSVRW
jgi:hypothetical protein